jgi:hypothetical protein
VFVLTAAGAADSGSGGGALVKVNGKAELKVFIGTINSDGTSVVTVPRGLTAPEGATVEVSSVAGNGLGRAWGYVAVP